MSKRTPRPMPQLRPNTLERFESKVVPDPATGCWLWSAARDINGYGKFMLGSKAAGTKHMYKAHRVAYVLYGGDDPGDSVVMHRCDEPACVNPGHLRLGTQRENVADMDRKGRRRSGSSEAAKTHCKHGHPYDAANTRVTARQRVCRTCERERARANRLKAVF